MCGAEYQPGFTQCSDCLVDLVEPGSVPEAAATTEHGLAADAGAAAAASTRLPQPVCVFRSAQPGIVPLAESMLQSAGIHTVVRGQHLQQLTGLQAFGPAEVWVSAADAADAREILADLDHRP